MLRDIDIKNKIAEYRDILTGRESRLKEMYRSFFSGSGGEEFARSIKKTNKTVMGGALAATLLVALLWVSEAASGGGSEQSPDLTRPSPYENAKSVDYELKADYGGETISAGVDIRILPRELGTLEAEEEIMRIARELPARILGENAGLDEIKSDLSLPDKDPVSGADIIWSSSNERLVSDEGRVNTIGAALGEPVALSARIRLGESSENITILMHMGAAGGEPEQIRRNLESRVDETVKALNESLEGEVIVLPEMTEDGVSLTWQSKPVEGRLPELLICLGILFAGFHYRYRAAAGRINAARDEMERDFPDFISKLSLLLGAGLVITSAIDRIIDDYQKIKALRGERRLYEELSGMRERMRAGNTPLVREITDLARRSGIREIARFSSVLSDNIDKGSALAEKLRKESELLWDSRKKRAEKAGHIAETKLIFPMVLQILCVIVITVMPAAFEMK